MAAGRQSILPYRGAEEFRTFALENLLERLLHNVSGGESEIVRAETDCAVMADVNPAERRFTGRRLRQPGVDMAGKLHRNRIFRFADFHKFLLQAGKIIGIPRHGATPPAPDNRNRTFAG